MSDVPGEIEFLSLEVVLALHQRQLERCAVIKDLVQLEQTCATLLT